MMPSVSIIIPARNEKKYIRKIVQDVLSAGFDFDYEIVFSEGHSNDGTQEEIKEVAEEYKNKLNIRYVIQDGIGKADAVWKGFDMARKDILMILDADLTVSSGDLLKFYQVALAGQEIFVNGSRMIYSMEKGAMRPLNYLGNIFFSLLMSFIIKSRITDTLCGTKAIYRSQFEKIRKSGLIEKLKDPFADFTLILGAKKLGLKIIEVPVFYKRRIYDKTKIRRFRDGWQLLKICCKYIF